jgi:hypothetical protein
MRAVWLIGLFALGAAAGCKDKGAPPTTKTSAEMRNVTFNLHACENAIEHVGMTPIDQRPALLLGACLVCGDWTPILTWNVDPTWNADPASGGPRSEKLEAAMVGCDAFCTGDSKMKFMAGVDQARGHSVDTPWRQLAATCKDKVNAGSDTRFMSAPYFALDRIARKVALQGRDLTERLAAVEFPLPALTVSGSGVALPEVAGVLATTGDMQVTVLADQLYVGTLPRAKLTAAGVLPELGTAGYPGELVTLDALAGKLAGAKRITLLAPQAMKAEKLVAVIATASAVAPIYLAGATPYAPTGWQLPGDIPVALAAGNDLVVTPEMTVQNLARELVARKQSKVGVTKQ